MYKQERRIGHTDRMNPLSVQVVVKLDSSEAKSKRLRVTRFWSTVATPTLPVVLIRTRESGVWSFGGR